MDVQTAKQKLLKANIQVYWERPSPNLKSVLLFLDTGDRVVIEDDGNYAVIGDNKDKINEILAQLNRREAFIEGTRVIRKNLNIKNIVKYIGSAVAGGIIGNRADKQVDNLLPDDDQDTDSPVISEHRRVPWPEEEIDPVVRIGTVVDAMSMFGILILTIKPDDGSPDIDVNSGSMLEDISLYDRVTYQIGGMYQARNVRRYIV